MNVVLKQKTCFWRNMRLSFVESLYPQKLVLTSPTCGGRSVCIVCLRAKATEFVYDMYLAGSIAGIIGILGLLLATCIEQIEIA
jgi:hypothetical protein